ncbi:MAG: hypothetical protein KDI92_10845 [Xanthomonadales bacterium]|nr:hypothetical protein [Xanthomonadales bacterium]
MKNSNLNNWQIKSVWLVISVMFLMTNMAQAGGRVKARATTSDSNGVSTATASAGKNSQGAFARVRGTNTDGQGNVSGGGATAVKGQNGAALRAGSFSADNSGTVNYHGSSAATGANGTAVTTGGFSANQGDGIKGSRSTAATANNGATYQGTTSYESGKGVSHTQVCYNAQGTQVTCPKK